MERRKLEVGEASASQALRKSKPLDPARVRSQDLDQHASEQKREAGKLLEEISKLPGADVYAKHWKNELNNIASEKDLGEVVAQSRMLW